VERQVGAVWQVAATYLASHTDRLWNQVALNPGVFLGVGPCTLQGVFYPTCSNPESPTPDACSRCPARTRLRRS